MLTRLIDQFHRAFTIVVATLSSTAPHATLVKNSQLATQLIHARVRVGDQRVHERGERRPRSARRRSGCPASSARGSGPGCRPGMWMWAMSVPPRRRRAGPGARRRWRQAAAARLPLQLPHVVHDVPAIEVGAPGGRTAA